jgi:elongation factor Ts
MAEVTTALIKELRDATNAGILDARKALQATDGDLEKAKDWLRQKGITKAGERAGRTAGEGVIGTYVHHNHQIATMVELNSESDFVARTDVFKNLARELAIQVAGTGPLYVRREEVPEAVVQRERDVAIAQSREQGKEAMADKIAEGKLNAFYSEVCLMEQKWAKDEKKRIKDLVDEAAAQLKEHIVVARFARFKVGEAPTVDLTAGEGEA